MDYPSGPFSRCITLKVLTMAEKTKCGIFEFWPFSSWCCDNFVVPQFSRCVAVPCTVGVSIGCPPVCVADGRRAWLRPLILECVPQFGGFPKALRCLFSHSPLFLPLRVALRVFGPFRTRWGRRCFSRFISFLYQVGDPHDSCPVQIFFCGCAFCPWRGCCLLGAPGMLCPQWLPLSMFAI